MDADIAKNLEWLSEREGDKAEDIPKPWRDESRKHTAKVLAQLIDAGSITLEQAEAFIVTRRAFEGPNDFTHEDGWAKKTAWILDAIESS